MTDPKEGTFPSIEEKNIQKGIKVLKRRNQIISVSIKHFLMFSSRVLQKDFPRTPEGVGAGWGWGTHLTVSSSFTHKVWTLNLHLTAMALWVASNSLGCRQLPER